MLIPLSRRYRVDRMHYSNALTGEWFTDTFDGRINSLDGNHYAQVFTNKGYVSKLYPMDRKSKAGGALKIFCKELGIPEKHTFGGSKE